MGYASLTHPTKLATKRHPTLQNLSLRQISHQRADAEGPGFAFVAGAHAVDQPAEQRRGDGNDIVALVCKTLAFRFAVLQEFQNSGRVLRLGIVRLLVEIALVA